MQEPLRLTADSDPREHAEAWVAVPELARLVAAFGGELPADGSLLEKLEYLDAFSDQWDYRGGAERSDAREHGFQAEVDAAIDAAAPQLGQLDLDPPARKDWDHVVILGGLLRACLARPVIAARMIDEGAIRSSRVTALGARRPFGDSERALALGPEQEALDNEVDALEYGVRAAFGLAGEFAVTDGPGDDLEIASQQRRYLGHATADVRVLAAPAKRVSVAAVDGAAPTTKIQRANTPSALAWFAEHEQLEPGASLVFVTTDQYRHYHLVEAVRAIGLPLGVRVDAIGMQPGDANPRLRHDVPRSARLQEIRSSIRSLRSLVHDLGD